MKLTSSSLSAQATAFIRALEANEPKEKRLYDDPVTRRILSPFWRAVLSLMSLPVIGTIILRIREGQFPGVIGNLFCRTRYIDDQLIVALNEGIEQVVILGAGFDSRAYRIPYIERANLFEVDKPATIVAKGARLTRVFGRLPAHVILVPIDFNQQDLAEVLSRFGFRHNIKTFFIWEGVTQYILPEAVENTLSFIREVTATGSKVVFTFIRRDIIDGTTPSEDERRITAMVRRFGAEWIFGIDPKELNTYLEERGFTLIEQIGTQGYRERYLNPVGRKLNIFSGELTALAKVK
jgi:methyltransferase (TIGR00027 family)